MQNVHPIFQQALRGIAPSADAKRWQAMCIQLRTELLQYDAPRCPRGQFAFTYQHPELGTLECHLEGERGDPDSGQRDTATLYSAYLRGWTLPTADPRRSGSNRTCSGQTTTPGATPC